MIKVSIIVPVYNVDKYLRRCIESIMNQTLKEIEIILVDDGSTDKSSMICDEYAKLDNRIKIIHKANGGLSDARNKGLDMVRGKYIGFVDSDDFVSIDMFNHLYNNSINADIVSCEYIKFYSDDYRNFKKNSKKIKMKEFNNVEALENYFGEYHDKREIQTVVWNKIYKKELFEDIRFPFGKLYEDGYVTYKLLYKSRKIVHLYEELYYYFQREDSLVRSEFSLKVLKSYDDRREMFKFLYDKVPSINNRSAQLYIDKYFTLYKQIIKSKSKDADIILFKYKIKNELKQDKRLIMEAEISSKLKLKVLLFIINYRFIYLFEYTNKKISLIKNIRNNMKNKIKLHKHNRV